MVFHPFLPRVQSSVESIDGSTLRALIRLGPIVVSTIEDAGKLRNRVAKEDREEQLNGTLLSGMDIFAHAGNPEQLIHAQGIAQFIVPWQTISDLSASSTGKNVIFERIIVAVDLSECDQFVTWLDSSSVTLAGVIFKTRSFSESAPKDKIKAIRQKLSPPGPIYFEPTAEVATQFLKELSSETADSTIRSLPSLILPIESGLTAESAARIWTSGLISDRPDGLYPTVVSAPPLGVTSSPPSGHVQPLGLVYSSKQSITESIVTGKGVYQSRRHGLWRKGESSGATQRVVKISLDCDRDGLLFQVEQKPGTGFCHENTLSCFTNIPTSTRTTSTPAPSSSPSSTTMSPSTNGSELSGIAALESTLKSRLASAPEGSYTARLFSDSKLLSQKIMEEADELIEATDAKEVAFEMADLVYFAMVKCIQSGVSWADVERSLDEKAAKGKAGIRRQGDAKDKYVSRLEEKQQASNGHDGQLTPPGPTKEESTKDAPVPAAFPEKSTAQEESIRMRKADLLNITSPSERAELLRRPVMDSFAMIERVKPIVEKVRSGGDEALKALTKQFDKADLSSTVLLPDQFVNEAVTGLPENVTRSIDQAYANIRAFHQGQAEKEPLVVETMPGVICTRFARPIDRVGLYVPGGTAILPSTALMLGVPAQVAGCKTIVLATPPRPDGSISPEVLYVAKLVGVSVILKAGGAQAVAAMAYGTESCPKVDKIFGPGNQWVTAAKMLVQNDTQALVGIDMPAGPSEVMVIADVTADPTFVASDLLSQAEHGIDSQVVLVAIDLAADHLEQIEAEVERQAKVLPRVDIVRQAIKKSLIVSVPNEEEAMKFSNEYAPEHLILHLRDAPGAVKAVNNAGSVFVGAYSPESCGDYASGTNHTLPTYGYARQFSGVNTLSFQKHITSQELTQDGLRKLGPHVVTLAECEGLEGHANAVRVRLSAIAKS